MNKRLIIWAVAISLVLLTTSVFVGCERIDAGHVGLKVNMTGGNQGVSKMEYTTGWCFYWRLAQKVYEFPTYQQHKEYEPSQVPAKGGTMFTIHPTFNYNLNTTEIAAMFQKFRVPLSNLEEGFLKTSMSTTIREITNTFTVDSILNNQAGYDAAILDKLNKQLHPFFQVTQFTANLTPDDRLKEAIVNKSKAIQEAQATQAQVAVAQATAMVDLTNVRKDSTILVMTAMSEAKAIEVKQQALQQSPQYIELIKAQKWNGVMPTVVSGSGTGMILQLGKQ